MKHSIPLLLAAFMLSGPALATEPTYPNLTYATLGANQLKLDLYIPTTGTAPYPLLIFIHGGGWSAGSRYPIPPQCELALQQGFAIASLDYRLTSQAALFAPFSVIFPAQINDVKGAVRWLRANAAAYQLDPTRFSSFGTSAGGHLSALLSTSGGVAALEGDVGGNPAFSSSVQAAVDFFGPADLLNMNLDVLTPPGSTIDHDDPSSPESHLVGWSGPGQGIGDIRAHLTDPTPPYPALVALVAQASPMTWIDASDPPMLIAHGTHDTLVPVNQSSKLSAALSAAGVSHDFRAIPGAGHGLGGPVNPVLTAFVAEKLIGPVVPDAGTAYCAGDGSAAACPCGNTSATGAHLGCRHSFIVGGNLNAIGVASVSNDTLILRGDSMPSSPAVYMQGTQAQAGGAGVIFGDGLLCVGGAIKRLGPKLNTSGWSRYPDVGQTPVSIKGGAVPGTTLYYQVWFRDPAAHCTSATWNLTNALSVAWIP
jgi:acetyl esterase/lipase